MGYFLALRGLSFVIADASPEVGYVWRSRWRLPEAVTAGQFNHLPGMHFPAEPDIFRMDDVVDFPATTPPRLSCRRG